MEPQWNPAFRASNRFEDILHQGKGPHIQTFTEEWRQEERERGRHCLFYFAKAILGFDLLGGLQYELARFLMGSWRRAVVAAYRGSMKCEMGDARVRLASGAIKHITDLVIGDTLASYDDHGRRCVARVAALEPAGYQECLTIRIAGGRIVRCSPRHRLFGIFGPLVVGALRVGDWVRVARHVVRHPDPPIHREEARLLAYMIAEGGTGIYGTSQSTRFTNFDAEIVRDWKRCAKAMGFRPRRVKRGHYSLRGSQAWLRRWQLAGRRSWEKRLHADLLAQPNEILHEFLGAFIACDGTVVADGKVLHVTAILSSPGLVDDLFELALSLGIHSTRRRPYTNAGHGARAWSVNDRKSLERFPAIPLARKQAALDRIRENKRREQADPFPSDIFAALGIRTTTQALFDAGCKFQIGDYGWTPREKARRMAAVIDSPGLDEFVNSDYGWERVEAIETGMHVPMYHLEVAGTERYISDGIVSHNSTLTSQAYPMWRGLYIPDWSAKLIENSADNAKMNHFVPLIDLFSSSPRSDYLQWMFQDRIPENFAGWNKDQIALVKQNPLAAPTYSYWGLDSRFEGWHGDAVIMDDPEGADADKSPQANDESYRAYQRAIPLLKDQRHGQILVVATAHGENPIIWRLREREGWGSERDNSWSAIKFFWRPLLRSTGKPEEPHRFPDDVVASLAKEEMFDQQFMLKKKATRSVVFRDEDIFGNAYEYIDPTRQEITYHTFKYDLQKIQTQGFVAPEKERVAVKVADLRTFIHADPSHRLESQMKGRARNDRPSRQALVVTGVAEDGHVFVLDQWAEDADISDLVENYVTLWRKWRCFKGTFEAIGAQVWFLKFLEQREQHTRFYEAMQHMRGKRDSEMPWLSSIRDATIEANKTIETKEWIYRERLSPYIRAGVLHLHPIDNKPLIDEMRNVSDPRQPIDLIDALSQGAEVWEPPMVSEFRERQLRSRRSYVENFVQKRTHIPRPYQQGFTRMR